MEIFAPLVVFVILFATLFFFPLLGCKLMGIKIGIDAFCILLFVALIFSGWATAEIIDHKRLDQEKSLKTK